MPEKAEAKANEHTNSLGVKCKTNVKAGNLLDDIRNQIDTDVITKTLQDYAMFPFSLTKDCNCDSSKS